MNRKLSAVIFDMDGLMFDTERLALHYWGKAAQEMGYSINDAVILKTVGRNIHDTREIILKELGSTFPFHEIRNIRFQYVEDHMKRKGIPVKPGLLELLVFLQSNHIPMAVATSTERERAYNFLQRAEVFPFFNTIICGDEIEKGKPEPDIFLKAAEKLGVSPEECIVLEDSESGIKAAENAGMQPIMVIDLLVPSQHIRDTALGIFESLVEVKEFLKDYF